MYAQPSAASYIQSQAEDDDYVAQPKPLAATLCQCDAGCSDACSRASCCPCPQSAACCGQCDCCCPDPCCNACNFIRKEVYAEYLYLRPLNAGVEYAVPFNGSISGGAVPLEEGRTATVNPVFSSGFRAGGGLWFDDCTAITTTFSHYENNSYDAISINPPFVLRAMVVHPSSLDADADWLAASAHQYIRFDLGDLDYRHEFYSSECSSIDYVVGIRYASLRQQFDSQFESVITGNVDTQVNFDGGGLRFGLEAQRYGAEHLRIRQGLGELPGGRIPRLLPAKRHQSPGGRPDRLEGSQVRIHPRLRGRRVLDELQQPRAGLGGLHGQRLDERG